MAFPIFGRGRALYALAGKGITKENVWEASFFLAGDCSCQIKAENPGTDLLMAADWMKVFEGVKEEPQELPPLRGLSPATGVQDSATSDLERVVDTDEDRSGMGVGGVALLVMLGIVVVIGVVSVAVMRRGDNV